MACLTIEVDLGEIGDGELIDELESRDYEILDERITRDEIKMIVDKFRDSDLGTPGYYLYEKLRLF